MLSRSDDVDGESPQSPQVSEWDGGTTGEGELLRRAIENLVSIAGDDTVQTTSPPSSSTVHVIGTGLTPNLLSLPLSTLYTLSRADAVLYDSLGLSERDIRRVVPPHCELICVGKRGDSEKSWKQGDIDDLLLQMASSSPPRNIVRLKGGDPFLFGRTRTEIDALRSASVPYTYTPGISSCIAGPHLGGIPLTDTSLNCQSFAVWSGTDAFGRSFGMGQPADDAREGREWQGLDVDVLVFLMIGRLDKLEALCDTISGGNDAAGNGKWNTSTPCAVIQNAGGRAAPPSSTVDGGTASQQTSNAPIQRVWRSTLGEIVSMIREEDRDRTSVSPAVFVVGATCELDLLAQDQTR